MAGDEFSSRALFSFNFNFNIDNYQHCFGYSVILTALKGFPDDDADDDDEDEEEEYLYIYRCSDDDYIHCKPHHMIIAFRLQPADSVNQ